MADSAEVNYVVLPLGAFLGSTEIPLVPLGLHAGGIRVVEAWLPGLAAGTTIGGKIVTMTAVATGGTPAISGTVGAFAGTVVTAAGVVNKLTISDEVVDEGEWLGFDQASGTVPAGSYICVAYVTGK